MFSNFDFSVILNSWRYLFFDGMAFTLTLTALAAVGGVVLGTLIAMMRLSGLPVLPQVAKAYVNFMRSLPLVLVIFWFYFLVPYIGQWIIGAERPIQVGAFSSSLITFTLFEAAYFSEIMRAGIQSIQKTQLEAADCLGLARLQAIVHVVLLPAMERVYPALSSQFVLLMLASSVTSQISAEELTAVANNVQSDTYRSFEVYIIVAVVYLVLSGLYRLGFWLIGLGLFTRKRQLGTAL